MFQFGFSCIVIRDWLYSTTTKSNTSSKLLSIQIRVKLVELYRIYLKIVLILVCIIYNHYIQTLEPRGLPFIKRKMAFIAFSKTRIFPFFIFNLIFL